MTRDVSRVLLTLALSVGLPFIVLAAVSAWLLRRRRQGRSTSAPWPVAFGVWASLALIASATVLRDLPMLVAGLLQGSGVDVTGQVGTRFTWSADGWRRLTYETMSTQNVLNAVLFMPAGTFLTLFTRRPWRVSLALGALSLAIEGIQGLLLLGAPDVADLAMNTAGGAAGAILGALVLWSVPHLGRAPRPPRRHMLLMSGVVATLCLALLVIAVVGAGRRQAVLVDEADAKFQGTTMQNLSSWTDSDQLEERAFRLGGTRADGAHYGADSVIIRYPASFLGVRRCVFVEWTADGAQVRRGRGASCSRFLG